MVPRGNERFELVALTRLATRMPFYKAICMFTVLHFPLSTCRFPTHFSLLTLFSFLFTLFLWCGCCTYVEDCYIGSAIVTELKIGQPTGHVRFLCVTLAVVMTLLVVVVVAVIVIVVVASCLEILSHKSVRGFLTHCLANGCIQSSRHIKRT